MGDFGSSVVRTIVPVIVGVIVSALFYVGVELDDTTKASLVTATTGIVTGLWYVLFRFLETKFSNQWGWFLGLAKQPGYPTNVPPAG